MIRQTQADIADMGMEVGFEFSTIKQFEKQRKAT